METVLDILSWICLVGGSFFVIVGGIGLIRFPDFYSRTHAAGITDTMGAGLILLGLIPQAFLYPLGWLVAVKLFLIMIFILLTSPTGTHALVKAAFLRGLEPWTLKSAAKKEKKD